MITLALVALAAFIVGRAFCVGAIAERNYAPWLLQFRATLREYRRLEENAETENFG